MASQGHFLRTDARATTPESLEAEEGAAGAAGADMAAGAAVADGSVTANPERELWPESISRFSRLRSVRISAATW